MIRVHCCVKCDDLEKLMSISTGVTSLRGQEVSIRRSSSAVTKLAGHDSNNRRVCQ